MNKVSSKGKKKKIVTVLLCCVLFLAAAAFGVYDYNAKKDYDKQTENAVAMGTVVTASSYGESAAKHNKSIIALVQSLEDIISWRVESSQVAKLNESGELDSDELAAVIKKCAEVSENSGGAFDITIGQVSRLWNFGTENEAVPEKKELENALETVGFEKLTVSGEHITKSYGQQVDLGAVGKGYACDLIYSYLQKTKLDGAVVSVGGSIVAYGNRNKAGDKWRIAIKHPRNQGYIGTVSMENGFVSTSGDYERYFLQDGVRYHHILDARTGYPADSGLISVTVVCGSGLLSDALSTACFILGKEQGMKLAEKYDVGAVFVESDLTVTTVGEIDFEKS